MKKRPQMMGSVLGNRNIMLNAKFYHYRQKPIQKHENKKNHTFYFNDYKPKKNDEKKPTHESINSILTTEQLQNKHRWFLQEQACINKAIEAVEKELAARNQPLATGQTILFFNQSIKTTPC